MPLTLLPAATDTAGLQAQITAAHNLAVEADQRAANARQMVLNRDSRLTSLEDVASRFATEIARTDQIHADLQAGIDGNAARINSLTTNLATEVQSRTAADTAEAAARKAADDTEATTRAAGDTALAGRTSALETAVAALQALKVLVGYGVTNLPASIAGGATSSVVVNLSRDMGSATYSVGYGLAGGASLLGSLQVVGVTAQTRTTVTVQIKNTGALALVASAASVQVVAARDA